MPHPQLPCPVHLYWEADLCGAELEPKRQDVSCRNIMLRAQPFSACWSQRQPRGYPSAHPRSSCLMHRCPGLCLQALKDSSVVEIVAEKVRRREEPGKWPLPGPPAVDHAQTDFSQLLNCPEFVPRQHCQKETGGSRDAGGGALIPPAPFPVCRTSGSPLPCRVSTRIAPCSHPSASQNRGGEQSQDAPQGPVGQPARAGLRELDRSEEAAPALPSSAQGGWGLKASACGLPFPAPCVNRDQNLHVFPLTVLTFREIDPSAHHTPTHITPSWVCGPALQTHCCHGSDCPWPVLRSLWP